MPARCSTPLKTILWDNDGVLVDTERLYFQANVEAFADVGFQLTPEMYRVHYLMEARGAWHLLQAEQGLSDAEIQSVREKRNERHLELLGSASLAIEGIDRVLEVLYRRYCMGIVTSSERDRFDFIHTRVDLLRYFDFVVAQGDYTHIKPHPEPYVIGVERSGSRPEECLVIEDSERGLIAARAAGLRCWVIESELTSGSDFSEAERVLQSPAEVLEYVN